MKYEPLGNLTKIVTGKRDVNAGDPNGKYSFFTCAELPYKINEYVFDTEAILVAGNGDLNVKYFKGKFNAYQRTYVIQITKQKELNCQYLYYFMRGYVEKLRRMSIGGIIKYIKLNYLTEAEIPLPPLDEQIRIATILTRAEALIAKRKESINALDELLKSTFLEMFGDPVRNEKGWKKKRIDEIANTRLGKMRDKKFITGNHLKNYLGNSNVRWFSFDFGDLEQMDFNEGEQIKFSLQYGDLLVCEGGEVGRCAIWKCQKEDIYFQKALHRVRIDIKQIKQEYLQYVFIRYSMFGGFKNVTSKATIAHLTGEKLKETNIPIPPITLQNQFAAIVEKVESLKAKYNQSLIELQNLYGSLSQRAFKGELDLSKGPVEKEKQIADLH